ncbi:MAG: methyl-accepting chemotaxis protein, partial [Marinomonas sp.]
MLANISFRTKLLYLLLTSILGCLIVTAVSLQGLKTQESSSEKFERLTSVDKNLSSLVLTLMDEYESLSAINDQTYSDFMEQMSANYQKSVNTLSSDIQLIDDTETQKNLQNITAALNQYHDALTLVINQRQKIGFSSSSGLKAEVATLGESTLSLVSFLSLIKQEFLPVREAE